jgi:acetyl esterase/lipase
VAKTTGLAAVDQSVRTVARFLPYSKGVLTRRLRQFRRVVLIVDRVAALRDVEVVPVSETATVRIHRPGGLADTVPAVLWIHGGGHVAGSAAAVDRGLRRMARKLGALVAGVEYRLAPEHPYPAALEDCYAALEWLAAQTDVDVRRIVIAGRSAGGGLAAALTLRCVDTGLVDLVGQVLIYPMLDDRTVRRSTVAGARGWTPEDNEFGWRAYLGCEPGGEGVSAYAAPARREDLSGLPPTWIGVGTTDLFYDEDVQYANRLRDAGVLTQLELVPGAFHGFDFVGPWTRLARRFKENWIAAMREFLAPDRDAPGTITHV